MKNGIYFIVFAIAFFSIPFVMAESDMEYTDRMFKERFEPFRDKMDRNIDTFNSNVDYYNNQLRDIDRSLTELKSSVKELQSTVDSLSKRVSDIDGMPPVVTGHMLPSWVLFIIIVICIIIFAFAIFLFWPRGKSSTSSFVNSSSRPKCPCCGREHDPGDTVCKNPNCKTQF